MPKYSEEDKQKAFDLYYGMGEDRTFKAVAQEMGIGAPTVADWAKKGEWDSKCEKMHMQEVMRLDDIAVEKNVEARQTHIRLAKTVQYKALMALSRMKFKTAAEAANALDKAIRIERQARGMSDTEGEKKSGDTYNVQNNNYNFSEAEINKLLDDELIRSGVVIDVEEEPNDSGEDQAPAEEEAREIHPTLSSLSRLEAEGRPVESPGEAHFLGVCPHERPASHPTQESVPGQAGVQGTSEPDEQPLSTSDREEPSDDGD